MTLPETIQDEEEAKKIGAIIKKAERQPEQVEIQSTMTIKEAFPDYLSSENWGQPLILK